MVTGVNGFVGKHLVVELKSRGCTVIGVSREPELHPAIRKVVSEYFVCDLTNIADVAKLPFKDVDAIINLAGFAKVGDSFGEEELYMRVNVGVLTTIGERILELGLKAHVLAISTGAVYASDQPMPLGEESEIIAGGSPYAMSKLSMEAETKRLRSLGLRCTVARPFNHIGPGQEPGFLVPDLYDKMLAALVRDGLVGVGDLSTCRDYTDVRDVAKAYTALVLCKNLDHELYNICSNQSVAGNTIFNLLKSNIGGSEKIKTYTDASVIRPNDPKVLYGDSSRLKAQIDWAPNISIEQTIKDFVDSKK